MAMYERGINTATQFVPWNDLLGYSFSGPLLDLIYRTYLLGTYEMSVSTRCREELRERAEQVIRHYAPHAKRTR